MKGILSLFIKSLHPTGSQIVMMSMTEGNNQNKGFKPRKKRYYPEAFIHEPARHPDNKDLVLHYDFLYEGHPVQTLNGPLVEPYIRALVHQVVDVYVAMPKVFALRVDLHFPADWTRERCLNTETDENGKPVFSKDYFTRFTESLKSKLNAYFKATGKTKQSRSLPLFFCRTYEMGKADYNRGVHIHALLMTNGHAFYSLGDYSSKEALAKRTFSTMVREAWASALFGFDHKNQGYDDSDWRSKIPNFRNVERVFDEGLVYFCRAWNERNVSGDAITNHYEQMQDVIFAASYLCKADTKLIAPGVHPFRCSGKKVEYRVLKALSKAQVVKVGEQETLSQLQTYDNTDVHYPEILVSGYPPGSLSDVESQYLYDDISVAWDYLDKKIEVSPDFMAVRFMFELDDKVLRLRKRYEYFEKFYRRLEQTMRYKMEHKGRVLPTDISHLKAFNTVQRQGKQFFMHGVLLIETKVFYATFESDSIGYLQAFLADEASRVYGCSTDDAERRLSIESIHSINGRHFRFESSLHSLRQHIAELFMVRRAGSGGSTLYLR